MSRFPLFSSLALALLLGACAQPQQAASAAPGSPCNEQAARFAIGYTQTEALEDEVQRRSGARVVRVVRPDTVHTMEYRAERINLELDAGSRVAAVRCG